MAVIRGFRDLDVCILAREQAKKIFALSKTFPVEEKYSLTDQIRRSSRAVNAMIAKHGIGGVIPRHSSIRSTKRWAKQWKLKLGWIMLWTLGTLTRDNIARLMKHGRRSVPCSTG